MSLYCLSLDCLLLFVIFYLLDLWLLIFFTFVFLFCMFVAFFCVLFLLRYTAVASLFVYKFTNHRQREETQQ